MPNFEEIVAYDYVKNEFNELLYMLQNRKKLFEDGVTIPNGVLLWGPTDCGKFFMAQELRKATDIEYLDIYSTTEGSEFADFLESMKDGGEYGLFIRNYENIKENPNIIRFIEMICEDAAEAGFMLFIIATMNGDCDSFWPYEEIFEKRIHVRYPDAAGKRVIFEHLLAKKDFQCDINVDDVCSMLYSGITYKEINYVIDTAIANAYSMNVEVLTTALFIDTYCEYLYDLDDSENNRSQTDIEHSAYHIAGHVVACELLHPGSVNFASIISHGTSNEMERGLYLVNNDSFSYEDSILEDFSSIAAVNIVFHIYDTNTYNDITRAIDRISRMVLYDGVEGLDLVSIYDEELCSSELKFRQEKTIHRIAREKMDEAKALMIENRILLDAVAEELMNKHYITASKVKSLGQQLRNKGYK